MTDELGAVTLRRPTGPEELALVKASGWRAWPQRLPDQPSSAAMIRNSGTLT